MSTDIDQLRAAVTRAQQGRARAEGSAARAQEQHDGAMGALGSEFGMHSLQEAEGLLADLTAEQEAEEERVRGLLQAARGDA